MTAPTCPYCHSEAVLCDASAVYGAKFEGKGNVWACAQYPECDAYVGAAQGMEPTPLGTLANTVLRGLRKSLRTRLKAERDAVPRAASAPKSQRREIGERVRELTNKINQVCWATDEECLSELARLVGGKEEA